MARRFQQLSFTGKDLKQPADCFGGTLLKGNPKIKRPLESKLPIHLVLRASQSTLRRPDTFGAVAKIIRQTAEKYGIKVFDQANVGNHLHLAIQVTKLQNWPPFIRELTSRIAAVANKAGGKFWLNRPYTRIVRSWKKAYRSLLDYIYLNRIEAEGFIFRREFRTLRRLREVFDESGHFVSV